MFETEELAMKIIIINKHYHRNLMNKFYVGRGSALGNKFTHLDNIPNTVKVESIEEAVLEYEKDLVIALAAKDHAKRQYLNAIYKAATLSPIYLECYCMDEIQPSKRDHACHATVIRDILLKKFEERGR